ncbi:hypothetical protein NDU88_005606 [Pleurodeles waltl]|uniref:XK-related protein n=1 Tax=Pleurodeles waltl TaxID=8319 RepID=A0AAV7UK08_PLEWA|nr:hypothetical protein NDU88_005606 [Pleurodeles waltl]
MSGSAPEPFQLRDLCLSLLGTGSFLCDMAVDLWVAGSYFSEGRYSWGGLVLALFGLSSISVQLFSWGWYRADERQREETMEATPAQEGEEPELCLEDFTSYRLLSSPRCRTLLHVCQLGFLLRCMHALEVGFQAYRKGAKYPAYSYYAYYLTHDISMLRLVETFIENVPQLTLVLYIVLYNNGAATYQYFSICVSFFAISWAVQDYHQSLRFFLKDKHRLSCGAVILYFIWNLFLICPRILCIAVFTVLFQYYICVHFLIIWSALQIWVWLQQTDFMKLPALEPFYRGTVALILYFSWFNVAEGRTVFRSLIYYVFITTDSLLLLITWWYYRDPLTTDCYALPLFVSTVLSFTVGLLIRCMYYNWFHPKKVQELCYDEVDSEKKTKDPAFRSLVSQQKAQVNPRMCQLSQNVFSASCTVRETSSQALAIARNGY